MEVQKESFLNIIRSHSKPSPSVSLIEIDERLRRRYLDRLSQKIKRLRKLFAERNWEVLRNEYHQLASSGITFGFRNLTLLATAAMNAIPLGRVSRAATPLYAKETTETLIAFIDSILIENTVSRI